MAATFEITAAAQGLYIVRRDHRIVARIANRDGRWMIRREDRAADAAYRGVDVTPVIHRAADLELAIAAVMQ